MSVILLIVEASPSPIQTLLSALELHQISRILQSEIVNDTCSRYGSRADNRCRLAEDRSSGQQLITAGWDFHPTPKEISCMNKSYHYTLKNARLGA